MNKCRGHTHIKKESQLAYEDLIFSVPLSVVKKTVKKEDEDYCIYIAKLLHGLKYLEKNVEEMSKILNKVTSGQDKTFQEFIEDLDKQFKEHSLSLDKSLSDFIKDQNITFKDFEKNYNKILNQFILAQGKAFKEFKLSEEETLEFLESELNKKLNDFLLVQQNIIVDFVNSQEEIIKEKIEEAINALDMNELVGELVKTFLEEGGGHEHPELEEEINTLKNLIETLATKEDLNNLSEKIVEVEDKIEVDFLSTILSGDNLKATLDEGKPYFGLTINQYADLAPGAWSGTATQFEAIPAITKNTGTYYVQED